MNQKLASCLIAGAILGAVLWLASGMLWLLPVGLALGLLGLPILLALIICTVLAPVAGWLRRLWSRVIR